VISDQQKEYALNILTEATEEALRDNLILNAFHLGCPDCNQLAVAIKLLCASAEHVREENETAETFVARLFSSISSTFIEHLNASANNETNHPRPTHAGPGTAQ